VVRLWYGDNWNHTGEKASFSRETSWHRAIDAFQFDGRMRVADAVTMNARMAGLIAASSDGIHAKCA
jgi:hypothetical protein